MGLRGEVVNVARGYARNFLLPRKLAEPATAGRVAELKRLDEQRARHEARSVDQANEIADVLRKTVLSFDVKSGPTGALFGSVTTTDIADELWRTRKIRVDRKKIGTDSIQRIGRYAIPIQIFEDVTVEVKTLVVPEGGELPPEEELAAMEAAEAEAEAAKEAEARGAPRRGRRRSSRPSSPPRTRPLDDPTPRQTPARSRRGEARVRAAPRRPRAGRSGRAGSRACRGRRRPSSSSLSTGAPQACGAPCELPALSGHGCCGQWCEPVPARFRWRTEGNTCSLSPAEQPLFASHSRLWIPSR